MFHFLLVLHGVLCLSMIGLVLLQQGKGADAGAIMGGSGDSVFGPGGGGSFATRLTTGIAVGFMITSILLIKAYGSGAYIRKQAPSPLKGSIMEGVQTPAEVQEQGEKAAQPAASPAESKVETTAAVPEKVEQPAVATPAPAAEDKTPAAKTN